MAFFVAFRVGLLLVLGVNARLNHPPAIKPQASTKPQDLSANAKVPEDVMLNASVSNLFQLQFLSGLPGMPSWLDEIFNATQDIVKVVNRTGKVRFPFMNNVAGQRLFLKVPENLSANAKVPGDVMLNASVANLFALPFLSGLLPGMSGGLPGMSGGLPGMPSWLDEIISGLFNATGDIVKVVNQTGKVVNVAAPKETGTCCPGVLFPASDGCNTCTCAATGLMKDSSCTKIACGAHGQPSPHCTPFTAYPKGDGTNTCTCPQSGLKSEATCTHLTCAVAPVARQRKLSANSKLTEDVMLNAIFPFRMRTFNDLVFTGDEGVF